MAALACARQDSNLQPSRYERPALTKLSYGRLGGEVVLTPNCLSITVLAYPGRNGHSPAQRRVAGILVSGKEFTR